MATREQTNNIQQSGSTQQSNRKEGEAQANQNERQRPIEQGREMDSATKPNSGLVRQRGRSPVYGGANSPFTLMRRMADDMDHLFEQFGFGRTLAPRFGALLDDDLWSGSSLTATGNTWSPQVETFRRGENLVVRADIPGVKKDDIRIEVENDVLTISGERRDQHEEKQDGYYRSERSYGQFYRAIPLPEGVNADKCNATFNDGVLEVTLPAPKPEERKAKQIQVK
jgi:HSP20 family protein